MLPKRRQSRTKAKILGREGGYGVEVAVALNARAIERSSHARQQRRANQVATSHLFLDTPGRLSIHHV